MPITYNSTSLKLSAILRKFREARLIIPDHQRDYVWSKRRQERLIKAVIRGKPIPSVLFRELDDDTLSLEDGQQRLRTLERYISNLFPVDGLFFRDLGLLKQQELNAYSINVVEYAGATDEEAREIFNDIQTGQCLTFGERIFSIRMTSPIARYAVERLLTPGAHFYDRLAPILGDSRSAKARRGSDMATAYALCAGFAFNIDYLSRKPDDADACLHREIDEAALDAKLEIYTQIWEEVNRRVPVTTKERRKKYWDLGTFGGYIVYSMELMNDADADIRVPATNTDELVALWAEHIATVYREPIQLHHILHRDLSAARSWKMARWSNGLRRLFETDNIVLEESDDDGGDDTE